MNTGMQRIMYINIWFHNMLVITIIFLNSHPLMKIIFPSKGIFMSMDKQLLAH